MHTSYPHTHKLCACQYTKDKGRLIMNYICLFLGFMERLHQFIIDLAEGSPSRLPSQIRLQPITSRPSFSQPHRRQLNHSNTPTSGPTLISFFLSYDLKLSSADDGNH